MSQLTIAIDGFSSTGKSTIAKRLAKLYDYVYVDTGAMYRAVTLFAFQNQFISSENFDKEGLVKRLNKIAVSFKFNPDKGFAEVYLNGKNVEADIRTLEVSNYVSQIAALAEVRQQLVLQQQQMGKNGSVIMDGRDIGTVVFPDADLKFFLTADAETRANRRLLELQNRGEAVTYTQVYNNIMKRDAIDSSRANSPLVKAEDAIEIDNSKLTLNEQIELLKTYINEYKRLK